MATYLLFTIIIGSIGVSSSLLFVKQNEWKQGNVILPFLSVFIFSSCLFYYFAYIETDISLKIFWLKFVTILQFLIAFLLLELVTNFIGNEKFNIRTSLANKTLKTSYLWRIFLIICVIMVISQEWFTISYTYPNVHIFITFSGELLLSFLFSYYLMTLYFLEKLFRLLPTRQKRIFILFIASNGIIAIGAMITIVRFLFYSSLSLKFLQFQSALSCIFYLGVIIGVARYRLWQEQLSIGRGIVYTSFTILFFGIFLITLGLLASFVRLSGIDFDEFDEFVLLFSIFFIGIVIIFSPHMRKIITVLSRKYIYKSKYDYRDQLLRLHMAHQSSHNIKETVIAFIDNLQYTIVVKKAIILIKSRNENSFYSFNQYKTYGDFSLQINSPLVKIFEEEDISTISIHHSKSESIANAIASEQAFINSLHISHLFSIKYQSMLLGILCIDAGIYHFDSEDLLLISMFCESIGTALYRDNIMSENIEQKQFESFNHMASFILHDIKNQVATLSLLTKNAQQNISDPDFHPVLLRSLNNCSSNLSSLISKLQTSPKNDNLQFKQTDCIAVINKITEQTKAIVSPDITIEIHLSPIPKVNIDEHALYFVLKNLSMNAIEAIHSSGVITFSSGKFSTLYNDVSFNFLTPSDYQNFQIYITVEDNGMGMSREFIENQLFKPFNTTKDKGVGIGLYQSKKLIESMNGRLLCLSEYRKGTRFFIFL